MQLTSVSAHRYSNLANRENMLGFLSKFWKIVTDRRLLISLYIFHLLYIRDVLIDIFSSDQAFSFFYWFGWFLAFYVAFDMLVELFSGKLIFKKQQIPFWIFFGWAFICTFFNPNGLSHESARQLALFLMNSYLLVTLKKRIGQKQTDRFFTFIGYQVVIVFLIINLVNLYCYVHYKTGGTELSGILASSNLFVMDNGQHGEQFKGIYEWMTDGSYRCLLSLIIGLILADKRKMPWLLAGTNGVICAVMLVLQDCRSSLIGLFLTAAFLIWYLIKKLLVHFCEYRTKYKLVQILLGILLFAIIISAAAAFSKLSALHSSDPEAFFQKMNSLSTGRWSIWQAAIKVANKSPIFGWGWGSFPIIGLDYLNYSAMVVDYHDIFINVLVFTGYPGLVLFLILILASYLFMVKNVKSITLQKNWWMFILCICFLISASLNPGVLGQDSHIEDPFFWLCLGCLIYPKPSKKYQKKADTLSN